MTHKSKKTLGKGFADFVFEEKRWRRAKQKPGELEEASFWQDNLLSANKTHPEDISPLSSWRILPFYLLTLVIFVILISRLWHLQVTSGEENLTRSEKNRLMVRLLRAPRGVIYDRNRQILVRNSPVFKVTEEDRVVDYQTALLLEAAGKKLEIGSEREYLYREVLAPVLGYTGETSQEELKSLNFANYQAGEKIGKMGLEATYETYLKGKDGQELVEISAQGELGQTVAKKEAMAGQNLVLALDLGLQKKLQEVLEEQRQKVKSEAAAAVAQDPKTGEILALVSLPSYDNNIFSRASDKNSAPKIEELFANPQNPLFNRVISATYPPGSIFKIVTSLSGLETGKIKKETKIEDVGVIFLGPFKFPNWYFTQYGRTEGFLDVVGAIKRSNDIFFYKVGEGVGPKAMAQWGQKLGLGKVLGLDLPGETEGVMPDEEWKKKVKKEDWFPGNTYHMAIGQGDVLVTPLQIVNLTSFMANRGTLYKPQLVREVVDSDGKAVKKFETEVLAKNLVSGENLQLVREGMRQACSPGGTGWPMFDFKVQTACKTGTAEYGPSTSSGYKTHAWFTVFAPYENPEIALTVLVEGGGEGSNVAAPVARKVLEYWFNR